MKKALSVFLVLILFVTLLAPSALALKEELTPYEVTNGYVCYYINKNNGRYAITTAEGQPSTDSDNYKNLLYMDEIPETSFATFRINGKDYIFGNDYGFSGGVVSSTLVNGKIALTSWRVLGVLITQTLTLITDDANPNVGNVRIKYEIDNQSGAEVKIGARILMDTQLGSNDASPMLVGNQYITGETEFTGAAVPMVWQSCDSRFAASIISYGLLSGWDNIAPDKMVVAHWETLSRSKWDYSIDQYLNFTTDKNVYGSADSAVALYYDPQALPDGEKKVYETFYGIGSTSDAVYNSEDLSVQISAPQKLTLNKDGSAYDVGGSEGYFEVSVDITNNSAVNINNITATIGVSDEMTLGGESVKVITALEPEQKVTLKYNVIPKIQQSTVVAEIGVTVASGERRAESKKYVILPSVKGEAPRMQMTEIAPSILYTQANKKTVVIKGSAFTMLKADYDWTMHLVNTRTGKEWEISRADITISDNTTMSISVKTPDSGFSADSYKLVLRSANYGNFSVSFDMSDDEKYNRKEYGVMIAGAFRESKSGEPVYDVLLIDNEAALASAEDLDRYLTDEYGDEFRSELPEDAGEIIDNILLTVRGEISSYTDEFGVSYYNIASGSILNSCIKYVAPNYNPDATIQLVRYVKSNEAVGRLRDSSTGKPLTAEQKKQLEKSFDEMFTGYEWRVMKSDSLVMTGEGSLYVGDYLFHNGPFYVRLEDGSEYALRGDPEASEDAEEVEIITPAGVVAAELFKLAGALTGFRIEVTNAVIGVSTVSLGGSFSLELPWWSKSSDGKDDDEPETVYKEGKNMTKEQADKLNSEVNKAKAKFDKTDGLNDGVGSASKNDSLLELNMQEMRYGVNAKDNSTELVGVIASGGIQLNDDSVPAFTKGGASAGFEIDSINYDGWYVGIEAGLKVGDAFEANAKFSLVMETGGKCYPDSVELVLGGKVMRIPLGTVGFLTKLGGGVYNLYDQIKGNYGSFPPVTVSLISGYCDPTLYSLILDTITLSVGGNGFSLVAQDGKIVGLKIIDEAYLKLYLYDKMYNGANVKCFDLSAGFKSNILGILRGEASIWLAYDPEYKGLFGPLSLGGKAYFGVFIPDYIPLVGGKELLAVMAELSTYRAYLGIRIIGIPISVSYYWADGKVKFFDEWGYITDEGFIPGSALDSALGIAYEPGDTNSDGVMLFGGNLSLCYNSDEQLVLMGSGGQYEYSNITVSEDYGLIGLRVETLPENVSDVITVIDSEGREITLTENENYLKQTINADVSESGTDEYCIYVSVDRAGSYTVKSDVELTVKGYDVASLPEIDITDVRLNSDSTAATVTWDTRALPENSSVSIYAAEKSKMPAEKTEAELQAMTEAECEEYYEELASAYNVGICVAENIDPALKSYTLDLSELDYRFESGEYQIRAVLYDSDEVSVSSAVSEQSFKYINPNTPGDIGNLTVTPAGNGQFKVAFNAADKADGYKITVFDSEDKPVSGYEGMTTSDTELYIGGTMNNPVYKTDADGSYMTDADGKYIVDSYETVGMFTGKSYKVSVSAYNETGTENTVFYGNAAVSGAVYLAEPDPAVLGFSVNGNMAVNAVISSEDGVKISEEIYEITVNSKTAEITINSDQDAMLIYAVDGVINTEDTIQLKANTPYALTKELGEGGTVLDFTAVNAAGDITRANLNITVDVRPPALMLDSTVVTSIDGNYIITGTAEADAAVYVGDSRAAVSDGKFTYTGTGNFSKESLTVRALDAASNETSMLCDVIPGEISRFTALSLYADGKRVSEDETYSLRCGDSSQISLFGVAEDGKEYALDGSKAEFSVIYGNDKVYSDESGRLTALYYGDAVMLVKYAVSDTYSLEQTLAIDIASANRAPTNIQVSNTDIEADAATGAAAARLLLADAPIGTSIEWSIGDNQWLGLSGNILTVKQIPDTDEFGVTVTASGKYLLDELAMDYGDFSVSKQISFRKVTNIIQISKQDSYHVNKGTEFGRLNLPDNVTVKLSDGSYKDYPVTWDEGAYNKDIARVYIIRGSLSLPDNVRNPEGLYPVLTVSVLHPGVLTDEKKTASDIITSKKYIEEDGRQILEIEAKKTLNGKQSAGISVTELDDSTVKGLITALREADVDKAGDRKIASVTIKRNEPSEALIIKISADNISLMSKEERLGLRIQSDLMEMTLSGDIIKSLAQKGRDITIECKLSDESLLNEKKRAIINPGKILDFTVKSGDETLSSFDGGTLTLSFPYTADDGSMENSMVWYCDCEGRLFRVVFEHNTEAGKITIRTPHLSVYVIGRDAVKGYKDISKDSWYYDSVSYAIDNSLMTGTSETAFEPDSLMSRAMLVTVLYRLENEPELKSDNIFKDVQTGKWYTDAAVWAGSNSIITGYENNLFGVNESLTREMIAVILYRYAKYKGLDIDTSVDLTEYKDSNKISAWAADAMKWANSKELITGRTSDTLSPNDNITRKEVATLLYRFIYMGINR